MKYEININIVRRLFVDVQSNRKRHKEIRMQFLWTLILWMLQILAISVKLRVAKEARFRDWTGGGYWEGGLEGRGCRSWRRKLDQLVRKGWCVSIFKQLSQLLLHSYRPSRLVGKLTFSSAYHHHTFNKWTNLVWCCANRVLFHGWF